MLILRLFRMFKAGLQKALSAEKYIVRKCCAWYNKHGKWENEYVTKSRQNRKDDIIQ